MLKSTNRNLPESNLIEHSRIRVWYIPSESEYAVYWFYDTCMFSIRGVEAHLLMLGPGDFSSIYIVSRYSFT